MEEPYSITKADEREMAKFVAQHVGTKDLLVFFTDPKEQWVAGSMYLGVSHYATPQSSILFLSEAPDAALAARVAQAEHVWLISPGLESRNAQVFPGSRVLRQALFPNIGTAARIELNPDFVLISSGSAPPATAPSPQ